MSFTTEKQILPNLSMPELQQQQHHQKKKNSTTTTTNVLVLVLVSSFFSEVTMKMPSHLVLEHLQRCSVCDPVKIFVTSKFSYVLFCNPTNKTETGTANRWKTTTYKPPGPIIMMGESETLRAVRSYLLHSFLQVHSAAEPFTSHSNLRNYAEPKPFS
jgi:hypothetical protein